jgi:hypothetical protein
LDINELNAQIAQEKAKKTNRLHTLYEKLQERLAVDLKAARDGI